MAARVVRWLRAPAGEGAAWAVMIALAFGALFAGAAANEIHGTAIFYASMAREIAESGDWLAVYRGPEAYLLKPPLVLWLTALAIHWFGPTSFAGTLFARLSGVAVVLLTWLLGRRLFGAAAGWFAAVVLVTNSTFHMFSAALRMDAMMTAGLLAAVLGYLQAERRWGPALVLGGVSVAVLAKGPQGFAPLALLPAHWLLAGRLPGRGRDWLLAAPLLTPALAWYGWLWQAHGMRAIAELAADAARGGAATWSAHLASAWSEYGAKPLRRFWPWLPFMLAGVAAAGARQARRATPRPLRGEAGLLLAWLAAVVAVAVVKPDHDVRYLYPALPTLAVLAGWMLARLCGGCVPRWVAALAGAAAAAVLVAVVHPGLAVEDTRPALARMRAYVDAHLEAGVAVPVVGFHVNNPPGPRRQSTHVDWVHYYLGRPARVTAPEKADRSAVAREPFVLVARYGDQEAVLERLGLVPLIAVEEMVLAVPRAEDADTAASMGS